MRKFLSLVIILAMLFCFASCEEVFPEVVSEKPINTEYVAAYDAMETQYSYKFDWWHGDFKYLPEMKMVHHNAVYKVQYEVVYSDGSTDLCWRTVSKDEYTKVNEQIKGE